MATTDRSQQTELSAAERGPKLRRLAVFLQANVEMHAVHPEVNVLPARQRSRMPSFEVLLPGADQARDGDRG